MPSIRLLATGLALCAVTGCNSQSPTEVQEKDSGLHINAPGVNIDIGGGKGVQVEAPGTDVDVKPGEGTTVTAPGTEVSTEKEN